MSSPKEKKLLILDLSSLVYRAYHALPPLTAATGEPAGALYGLFATLLRELRERKPAYVVAACDMPGKTFRHETYEAYKATRPETPDDLILQLKRAKELLNDIGISVLGAEGYEADDVIASVVATARQTQPEIPIEILSNDADILQLVDARTSVVSPRRGIADTVVFTPERVEEKLGISPKLVPSFKALSGDPSDNIPGVRGIGKKTAASLLASAGSLEALIKSAGAVSKGATPLLRRFAPLLSEHRNDIKETERFVTLRQDAPITFKLEDAVFPGTATPALIAALKRLGFESLLRRAALGIPRTKSAKTKKGDGDKGAVQDRGPFIRAQEVEVVKEIARLEASGGLTSELAGLERKLIPVISAMEHKGILVDRSALDSLRGQFLQKKASLEKEIFSRAGKSFNLASPKQLGEVLFEDLDITSSRKTAKGKRSTAADVLYDLRGAHPIVEHILAWRETAKLLSTYVEAFPELIDAHDQRIHATFWQLGTATGRIASSDPNLQNIPLRTEDGRAVRNIFCAPKGRVLVAADYEQIELRVAAILSEDATMLEAFRRGNDIHNATASRIFHVASENVTPEMRRRAKVLNFGIIYGMGPKRVSKEMKVSFQEAQAFLDEYFTAFPGLASWTTRVVEQATRDGFTQTAFGRKRFFPELASLNHMLRSQAERAAVNAPIQGTATGDLIKRGMVALAEQEKKAEILVQVHDEILCETDETYLSTVAPHIRTILESVWPEAPIAFPVKLSAGPRWGSLVALTGL